MLLYLILFTLTVIGAAGVLFNRDTVKAAMCLIGVMIGIAANFLLMGQEFVAFIQIIVYAGAIMVVFLFVIMLLNLREKEQAPWYLRNARMIGGALAAAFFFISAWGVRTFFTGGNGAGSVREPMDMTSIATALITQYVGPFLLTSVLLLVAVIGAVAMARRKHDDGTDLLVEED